jgi:hypothetical protein
VKPVNRKLVEDLGRLAARYPPSDWRALLECLEDETRRNQVRELLLDLQFASSSRPRRPTKARSAKKESRAAIVRDEIRRLRETEPARADFLDDVWMRLRARELLPKMPMVRAFAETVGMKGLEATAREQAVSELMAHLVHVPPESLERSLRETTVDDRQLGEEYERWVRLILGERRGAAEPLPNEHGGTGPGAIG